MVRNCGGPAPVFRTESGNGREGGDGDVEEHEDRRGGAAIGIVLLILLPFPFWANLLIVLGIPTAAYLALDPSQRRRLRRVGRKELGR